jgi:DNA topoisomerase VI B subunit
MVDKSNDKSKSEKKPEKKDTSDRMDMAKNMPRKGPTAEDLAKGQREISVAEFFEKNRHLLGFDNPRKALLTAIKEAVDNALDASEEAKILPEISIEIIEMSENRYRIIVEDNGPGIVKEQIPKIFAKLLYGSKFHRLRQSLTADEPILLKRNGKVEIIPIGEFIDKFVGSCAGTVDIIDQGIQVPAFNQKNNLYELKDVSHVIKHRRANEILKIKTQYNKEIKVTGCHSLFAFNPSTSKIEAIEARNLGVGSYIVVPKKLPEFDNIKEINILKYIPYDEIKNNWLYVYGIGDLINMLVKNVEALHKKTDKSRRYYRLKNGAYHVDILDDSLKQYIAKGFLPLKTVYELGLINDVSQGVITTYYHGQKSIMPVTVGLSSAFFRFLGLYLAEGHCDTRQIGLTFGKHERGLIEEMARFASAYGIGFTHEVRDRSIRIKLFNQIFVKFIAAVFNKGAHNKQIPEFIFRANEDLRWHFIDSYCQGDGHRGKCDNALMFTTVSEKLALGLQYLLLMNGVTSTHYKHLGQGLGKKPSIMHRISVYGNDLDKSHIYFRGTDSRVKSRDIEYNYGKVSQLQKLDFGDLAFVKIKNIEVINEGHEYVYDISVPDAENFVGGIGGITCHNSRGQQGIGISAAVMFAQLTTGRPTKILSKTAQDKPAHYMELHLNTQTNSPEIMVEEIKPWDSKDHGTRIEMDLEASYIKGDQSVDQYLKETAIVNPHATIIYTNPKAEQFIYTRATDVLPKEPLEIKPHPYGLELGILMKLLKNTESRTLNSFLMNDLSRVGSGTAKEICEAALIDPKKKPEEMTMQDAEKLMKAIKDTRIMSPTTDCLSPIGEELLEKSLKKEINAEFYCAITRPIFVYRGNPFQIEVGLAYGGDQPKDEAVTILRYANRVPLLYQQGACAFTKSIVTTNWKAYGIQQTSGSIPNGPLTVLVHMCSVWVPFTSESKEALAHYPDIIKEIKLAIQEAGRKLQSYVHKKNRVQNQLERANLFERYMPEVADALSRLTGENKEILLSELKAMTNKDEIKSQIYEMESLKGESNGESQSKRQDFEDDNIEDGVSEESEEDE